VPHASTGIRNVTLPTWDQMYVAVEDRLAGHLANVHADVEAIDSGVERQDFFA
jgi:hypothetical protein